MFIGRKQIVITKSTGEKKISKKKTFIFKNERNKAKKKGKYVRDSMIEKGNKIV